MTILHFKVILAAIFIKININNRKIGPYSQFYSLITSKCVPLRLWGIVITRGGRAVRNSAFTKKFTDEFCLFFTDMTYVSGQFIPYIFFPRFGMVVL